MKKQIVSILTLIICAMFAETTAIAQGIIIHKKNGEEIIVPYSALDSIATYTAEGNNEEINGHECVDLGLSVRWATCNVGAYSPEEYGDHYAWGEICTKSRYEWTTYKWCNGTGTSLTKYNTDSYYGIVDNKTVIDLEDDVAHVKWGGSWRTPTLEEIKELVNKCTWEETTQNGQRGQLVKGPNGNRIFLPSTGFRIHTDLHDSGLYSSYGYYWSATLMNYDHGAYYLYFNYDGIECDTQFRYWGFTVRPVTE